MKKGYIQTAFIKGNGLKVLADWLAPLPDMSLPCIKIRFCILKLLKDLPVLNASKVKESGIENALWHLHGHPKEIKQNKDLAANIVQ